MVLVKLLEIQYAITCYFLNLLPVFEAYCNGNENILLAVPSEVKTDMAVIAKVAVGGCQLLVSKFLPSCQLSSSIQMLPEPVSLL